MKRFTALYRRLDASTSTLAKVAAMVDYFRAAPAADAAWASYFLAGGKPRQVLPTRRLRELACAAAGIAEWLFDECYAVTGDLAEAIAYLLPAPAQGSELPLAAWLEQRILPLRALDAPAQREALLRDWAELDAEQRFIHIKLIGGGFRVGVSRLLVQRALAQLGALDDKVMAQRMIGYTDGRQPPSAERYARLLAPLSAQPAEAGAPYPFFLAHALALPAAALADSLGPPSHWLVEWKFDGIRAQVVRRQGRVWIWSRGEELVSERFPEVCAAAAGWPDGSVLDGELLAWLPGSDRPAPFALLQRRIARLAPSKKVLAEAPVVFVAYDLLQADGADLRALPQHERRRRLEALAAAQPLLKLSERVVANDWAELAALRATARQRGVEGLMLKHVDAHYGAGRTRADGVWWKWKVDPLTVDAVLVYAQAGHGRRANVYTDYTFALWSRPPADAAEAQAVLDAIRDRRPAQPGALQLVAFAKAYSGLTDDEFKRVDQTIRATTVERFGPVRSVVPRLVFELGFEGLARSTRHKSGIATRFPRMLRIRDDKPLHEADSLATLHALLAPEGAAELPAE